MVFDVSGRYGVVSTGTSLAALAIDWADHSIYNHAFVVVDLDGGIVEATPDGVRRGKISEYAGHPMMLNTDEPIPYPARFAVCKVALGFVGRRYGWDDILRLALARFNIHFHWLDRHVSTQTDVICSQLVAEVGHTVGLDWSCGKQDLADVTPGLLAARPGMKPYILD